MGRRAARPLQTAGHFIIAPVREPVHCGNVKESAQDRTADIDAIGFDLYHYLRQEIQFEEEPFFLDLVARVSNRLQSGCPEHPKLEVVVPWMQEIIAFTGPGKYIYFSRRLLERCPKEEHAAFIIGHELAHHHLNHVNLFKSWFDKLAEIPGVNLLPLVFVVLERRLYGPERECDADRYGLELCMKAGYEPRACLEIFDTLEHVALDKGDIDIVYGPDPDSDDELAPDADWKTKTRIWWWQRTRGYLPIRDRRQLLLSHLARST